MVFRQLVLLRGGAFRSAGTRPEVRLHRRHVARSPAFSRLATTFLNVPRQLFRLRIDHQSDGPLDLRASPQQDQNITDFKPHFFGRVRLSDAAPRQGNH